MRLMLAMAGARHGGAERFFERLAVALARTEPEMTAVIRRDPERAGKLRAAGIAVTELRFGGPADMVGRWQYRGVLRSFRPDVVLSFMSRAAAACPRPSDGLAYVHVGRLGGYYDLKYYRTCDHLIGNTPDIRDYLIKQGIPADRAHYLPNFAEEGTAEPLDRARHDTPADAPLLVALGRLHANKAFDVLLDALAAVPRAHLWLGGEGPLRDDLEAQARMLGVADRVRFLGWQDDPRPVLAAADVVVVPSRHEPLGNVILEAWAQAKPVVAAAAAGPAQLIDDAETGLLVDVDDAPALAAALASLIDDPARRKALGDAGKAVFEARFGERTVVRAYLDFFHTLIDQKAGAST